MRNETNTSSATTTPATLNDGNTVSLAHKIRKEAAEKFSCPLRFVSWKSCMLRARGDKRTPLNDAWGYSLGSVRSKINFYLCNESAIVVDEEHAEESFPTCNWVKGHLARLVKQGKLARNWGSLVVSKAARPFPQPLATV